MKEVKENNVNDKMYKNSLGSQYIERKKKPNYKKQDSSKKDKPDPEVESESGMFVMPFNLNKSRRAIEVYKNSLIY